MGRPPGPACCFFACGREYGGGDSLLTAAKTIRDLQQGGSYVGCIEELVYQEGWISTSKLRKLGEDLCMTDYGQHILKLCQGV